MSTVSAPYGLRPVRLLGGQPYAGAIREIKMTTNSATGIFTGDLVSVTSGEPAAATATPTTTRSANTPVGVCVGVRYTDVTTKQEYHTQYFPAGGITTGHTNVYIKVCEDPDVVFMVQADGAMDRGDIGLNAALKNFSAGSTTTGLSGVQIDSATEALTATLAVRIVDVVESGQSTSGDAYTDMLVVFNQGVHALRNSTGA